MCNKYVMLEIPTSIYQWVHRVDVAQDQSQREVRRPPE